MPNVNRVIVYTSPAVSLINVGFKIASVLVRNGVNAVVFNLMTSVDAQREASLNPNVVVINVVDPFVFFMFRRSMPNVRDVITYVTADGVPATELSKQYWREICKSTYVIANSKFSKENMEAIDCVVNEVIPNGIDWSYLSSRVNHGIREFDIGSVGYYNPGLNERGNNWMYDRKGMLQLTALLIRLYRDDYPVRAWIHTSPEVPMRFRSTKLLSEFDRETGFSIEIRKIRPESFLPPNIKFTSAGSLRDVSIVYSSVHTYVSMSLIEGFGLTPLEALATGTRVVVNEIPTFKEIFSDAPSECVKLIPHRGVYDYLWGLGHNKLLMKYHVPDTNAFREEIINTYLIRPRYDPLKCSMWARKYDIDVVYRRFYELIVGKA